MGVRLTHYMHSYKHQRLTDFAPTVSMSRKYLHKCNVSEYFFLSISCSAYALSGRGVKKQTIYVYPLLGECKQTRTRTQPAGTFLSQDKCCCKGLRSHYRLSMADMCCGRP